MGREMRYSTPAAVCLLLLLSPAVQAEVRPGDQGLGLVAGSPIGLTYKYWYSRTMAVDAGLGAIGGNFAFYATHLWHDFSLLPKPASWDGQLPFYFGVGTRVRFTSDPRFGVRTIVGTSFIHSRKPFEIFGELGPFIRLTPDVGVSIDGGVGFRYYFKSLVPSS